MPPTLTNIIPSTNKNAIAIDLELFEMYKRRLHRPEGSFACAIFSDGDTVWLIDDVNLLQQSIDAVSDKLWIMHNSQFDLFHLRRWAVIPERKPEMLWDTMVIDRLMWSGYYETFSLDDLARRYLDMVLDKKIRKDFEHADKLTPRLREYAATDAWVTYLSYEKQIASIEPAILKLWLEVEAPMIEAALDFKGFSIDKTAWVSVAEAYEEQRDSIKRKLDFNPASPKQVIEALKKQNIHVSNTRAPTLEDYKNNSTVAKILSFRKAMKLAGTYGRQFIETNMEADGKVYAHYWTLGASTGRMASANPNMQNIPRPREFRAGFVASRGNRLVVADYSQQEPRIAAYLSKDDELTQMFETGADIHLEVARWVFDEPQMVRSDPRRYVGKTLNLAITYGLTAKALSERVNTYNRQNGSTDRITVREAQQIINKYFMLFDELKEWIDHMKYVGKRDEYVSTVMGRKVWLNMYNRQWVNNAVNAPIQGGAADQMKLALLKFRAVCKRLGWHYPVVAVVHDEIVLDVPKDIAEQVKDVLVQCMKEAGHELYPDVPWHVDAEIGETWAVKA